MKNSKLKHAARTVVTANALSTSISPHGRLSLMSKSRRASGAVLYRKQKQDSHQNFTVKGVASWVPVFYDTFQWAESLPWWQLVPVIVLLYLLMSALFALLMLPMATEVLFDGDSSFVRRGAYERLFYFSSSTILSLGCEYAFPNSTRMHLLFMAEQMCGMLMNLLLFGVLLSKFTKKSNSLVLCSKVVLSRVEGCPCLVFRIGHIRGDSTSSSRTSASTSSA